MPLLTCIGFWSSETSSDVQQDRCEEKAFLPSFYHWRVGCCYHWCVWYRWSCIDVICFYLCSQFLKRLTNECSRRLLTGQRPGSYAVAVAECFLSHFAPSGQVETEGSIGAVALNGVPRTNSSLADNSAAATGGVKVYAHYCTNYPRSLQVLSRLVQPESRSCALLAKLQLGLGHRMQLGSYLLKPVQRILKVFVQLKYYYVRYN